MIWWGIEFTRFGWNQTSELADLPMWLIFIAWPVTGVSWLAFQIERFRDDRAAWVALNEERKALTAPSYSRLAQRQSFSWNIFRIAYCASARCVCAGASVIASARH